MNRIEWVNGTSVEGVIAELGEGATVKAAGVDLLDLMKERVLSPKRLVNLRTVAGLDDIAEEAGGLAIGPLVTLARIADDERIRARFGALHDAASHTATPQIRNMATLGGSLLQRPRCWYFRSAEYSCKKKGGATCFALDGENAYHALFDNQSCAAVNASSSSVALTALGASLAVRGSKGERQLQLPELYAVRADAVREHVLAADELITRIHLPKPPDTFRSAYRKIGEKESFDWPLVEAAVGLQIQNGACTGARVVVGAVAGYPLRLTKVEQALVGKPVDPATVRAAAALATAGATPLAQNAYKLKILTTAVERTVLDASTRNGGKP